MAKIPLRELLATDFFRESKILAGESKIDNEITSVNVIDSPLGYKYVSEGAFVVTSAYYLLDDTKQQILLLKNLAERRIAALGIDLCFFNQLPREMKLTADEYNLPIVSLNCYFYEVLDYLSSNIYLRRTKDLLRTEKIYDNLLKIVTDRSFKGVAQALNKWTGLDAFVCYERKVYQSPENFLPPNILEVISADKFERLKYDIEKVSQSDRKKLYNSLIIYTISDGFRLIGIELLLNIEQIGYIFLAEKNQYCDENDCRLLEIAKSVCEIEIQRIANKQIERHKQKAYFTEQLLKNRFIDQEEAAYQAKILSLQVPINAAVCCVVSLDKEESFFNHKAIEIIEDCFMLNSGVKPFCTLYGYELFFLLPKGLNRKVLSVIRDKLAGFVKFNFAIGVGKMGTFPKYQESYYAAKYAIKIGTKTMPNQNSCGSIYNFSELGIYRLLSPDNINSEIVEFYRDYLGNLAEYDRKNKTELIRTLHVFLHSGCSWNLTAARLFLHPNTVRYRIGLIEKLCGVDLKQEEDRFNISLALRINLILTDEYK